MAGMTRSRLITLAFVGLSVSWYVVLGPTVIGGQATYLTVSGDSMVPVLASGDLVIVRRADAYAVGDIVAFHLPNDPLTRNLVIHRIAGGTATSGWTMRGDNNPGDDPWRPISGDLVGKAWIVVPGAGRALAWFRQPAVFASFAAGFVVFAFLLGEGGSGERTKPARPGIRRRWILDRLVGRP